MNFSGRTEEISRLVDVLNHHVDKPDSKKKLVILSVEGPGGVGKSTLIDHAEELVNYKEQGTLRIFIDGSEEMSSLPDLVRKIVHAAKLDTKATFSHENAVFEETEKALIDFDDVVKLESEKIVEASDDQKRLIAKGIKIALVNGGSALLYAQDPSIKALGAALKAIDANVTEDNLIRFQDEVPGYMAKIGIGRLNERNAIRENAKRVFANALEKDLTTLISGYKKEDFFKFLGSSIEGCNRLTIILDDYEKIFLLSDDFFPNYFLRKLKEAEFKTVAIVSGRDDLTLTHTAWEHHLDRSLLRPCINVGPLSYEQAEEIAKSEKVDPQELWSDTEGYPFYMQLWIDSRRRGGDSAVLLRKFYERTTKWMTEKQRSWLEYCLFIDNINVDSIASLVGSPEEADAILKWFEGEASIRATDTKTYTVRSFLRKRLIEYLEIKEPSKVESLKRRAQEYGLVGVK